MNLKRTDLVDYKMPKRKLSPPSDSKKSSQLLLLCPIYGRGDHPASTTPQLQEQFVNFSPSCLFSSQPHCCPVGPHSLKAHRRNSSRQKVGRKKRKSEIVPPVDLLSP